MYPAMFVSGYLKLVGCDYYLVFIRNAKAIRFSSILPVYWMTSQTFTTIIDNLLNS